MSGETFDHRDLLYEVPCDDCLEQQYGVWLSARSDCCDKTVGGIDRMRSVYRFSADIACRFCIPGSEF